MWGHMFISLKPVKKLMPIFIFVASLISCSVYKTQARKDFENQAPQRVNTSSCKVVDPVQAWWLSEFPDRKIEPISFEQNKEVWAEPTAKGTWNLRSLEFTEVGHLLCEQEFTSLQQARNFFQKEQGVF